MVRTLTHAAAEAPWTTADDMRMIAPRDASVAQLDRVLPSEGRGRGFESRRMRQLPKPQVNAWGFSVSAGATALPV